MGNYNQQNCFMLKDKGKQHGPYDMKQLAEMAKAANFTGNTLVWRPGMNSWTKAAKVGELELLLNNPYVFDTMGNQQTQSVQQTPHPQPMIPPQQLSPVQQTPMPEKNYSSSVPPPFHGGPSAPPPPPFRPSKQYYMMMNNQQFGPYDTEQMKQFAKDGRLTRDTFVWSEGMAEWMKSEKVDDFSSFFKPQVVPPTRPTSPIPPPPVCQPPASSAPINQNSFYSQSNQIIQENNPRQIKSNQQKTSQSKSEKKGFFGFVQDIFQQEKETQQPQEFHTGYSPELNQLIELALADGVITEKEREVIRRKAKVEGVAPDEIDIVLDGRLSKMKSQDNILNASSKQNDDKHKSNVRKCSACGAIVDSFITRCPECGNELKNIGTVSSFNCLMQKLSEIDTNEKIKTSLLRQSFTGRNDKISAKKTIITTFPIPTMKEDLLEFLSMSIPLAQYKGTFLSRSNIGSINYEHNQLVNAWKAKVEQVIVKSRIAMKDDKEIMAEIDNYAKEIGFKIKKH